MNGNSAKYYIFTIDFAKHIAMQAKAEKNHEYRD